MIKRYKPWPPRRSADVQEWPSDAPTGGAEPERARLSLFGGRRRKPVQADPAADGKPTKFELNRLVTAVIG